MSLDIPNVFDIYPNEHDASLIRALFEAQSITYHRVVDGLKTKSVSREKCFDEFIPAELLMQLEPFGEIAVSALHNVAERTFDVATADVKDCQNDPVDDDTWDDDPHKELGFSVPAYYLSFFFDEITSVGFANVGPMPTSLDRDTHDGIAELMILNDSDSEFHGVFISRDQERVWA